MSEDFRISFHDQIASNKWKSVFLIFIVFLVFLALGYIIALVYDPAFTFIIMIFAIIFSLLYIWMGYFYSDKIALSSVGAIPASDREYRQYHNVVEGLCLASGMPKPRLYVMKDSNINAFASGRNPEKAVICVTTGALEKLNKQELEGVIGHELSHIANYDIRFMTLTAVLVGMIAILSEIFLRSLWLRGDNDNKGKAGAILLVIGILLAILAPILTQLVQFAISRKREYAADASSVKFIRSPSGLVGALKKIKSENTVSEKGRISKAVAPLFISSPFRNAFSTHPPLEERIRILEKM